MKSRNMLAALAAACVTFGVISTAHAWPEDQAKAEADARAAAKSTSEAAAKLLDSGNSDNENILKAQTGNQQTQQKQVAQGGGGTGTATIGASGNNNGSTFNTTTNEKNLTFFPVQPAELPPTITVAGIHLEKAGRCGARVTVDHFKRQTIVPIVAGLFTKSIDMPTMQGLLTGFDEKMPFIVRRDTVPQLVEGKFVDALLVTVYGHQLYLSVEQVAQGGSASSAANYAAEKAIGAGVGLSASTAFGVVGVVAVPCEYDVEKGVPKKEVPVVTTPPSNGPTLAQCTDKTVYLAGQLEKCQKDNPPGSK